MKKSNPWFKYVKQVQQDNDLSYSCALCEASKTYQKKGRYILGNEQNQEQENFDYLLDLLNKKEINKIKNDIKKIDKIDDKIDQLEEQIKPLRKRSTKEEREQYLKNKVELQKKIDRELYEKEKLETEIVQSIVKENQGELRQEYYDTLINRNTKSQQNRTLKGIEQIENERKEREKEYLKDMYNKSEHKRRLEDQKKRQEEENQDYDLVHHNTLAKRRQQKNENILIL